MLTVIKGALSITSSAYAASISLLFFLMLIIFVISNYRISAYFKSTICFRISIISDYKYISDYLIFLIPNEISMYDLLPSM